MAEKHVAIPVEKLVRINDELKLGYSPIVQFSRDEMIMAKRAVVEMQQRFYNISQILTEVPATRHIINYLEPPKDLK